LRQIAFHAARIEVAVQRTHQQSGVHIRRNDLFLEPFPRVFADKSGAAQQDLLNDTRRAPVVEFHRHPIADGRPFRAFVRGQTQLAGSFRPAFAEFSRNAPEFPLLRNHPRRHGYSPVLSAPDHFKV
jgi:hypothetical protein